MSSAPSAPSAPPPRAAPRSVLHLTIALAALCMVLLTAMVAITAVTGVSQEAFEVLRPDYAAAIARAAPALRLVIALDTLFLIAYTAVFALLVQALGVAPAPLARLGVRLMIAVAVLDLVEDQHLLALARSAAAGARFDELTLRLQQVLSQSKFLLSYLALAMLALGLPRADRHERAFALMLGVPLPLLGALQWAVPALEAPLNVGRWVGFLAGFAAAIWVLARRASGAAATGAPA